MSDTDDSTVEVELRNDQTARIDAEDLLNAIDEVEDEDVESRFGDDAYIAENGVSFRDDFVIHGDGAADPDIFVVTEKGASGLVDAEKLRARAEDAIDEPFEDYLQENVFTAGRYVFEDADFRGTKVAEYDDGMGYTPGECIENAAYDDGVEIYGIKDGWLILQDER